jgi:hypothetical protein
MGLSVSLTNRGVIKVVTKFPVMAPENCHKIEPQHFG